MNRWWLIIWMFFAIQLAIASADTESKFRAPLKIQEVNTIAILHPDGSVSYSETLGLVYDGSEFSDKSLVIPNIPLPQEASISPNVKVVEEISGEEYTKVYRFDDDCRGQFIFQNNQVLICIPDSGQVRLTISLTILPSLNFTQFSQCGTVNDYVRNEFKILLPGTEYDYPISVFLGGSEEMSTRPEGTACTDSENSSLKISNLTVLPATNGFICSGEILAVDKDIVEISVGLAGENIAKAAAREKEELEVLQKESINASILASNATERNAWFTLALVLITLVYAGVSYYTLKEVRKSNQPLISARLDPLGISQVVLKIINVGSSTARNVTVNYTVEPNGPSGRWQHHLIQKDDFARLVITENGSGYSFQNFVNKFEKIKLSTNCEDIHQKSHPDEFEINLKDIKKSMDGANWVWDTTFKEDIETVAKKIKEISDTLKTKEIKVNVKNVDLNPEKIKSEIRLYEKLAKQKKQKLKELQEKRKEEK